MEVKERVFDVDAFWRFVHLPENADKRFELINGDVIEMPRPGEEHGFIAAEIFHRVRLFDPQRKLGNPSVDAGFYSLDDRHTLLGPDFAFRRTERPAAPFNKKWTSVMPDLAVEVKSPSNTLTELRQKAAIYLRRESQLVWIIFPSSKSAEVHRRRADGEIEREIVGQDGVLSGEDVLPGFRLELSALFS